jgi:prepilin-type N-terminal cleavage/methylation domain-containing protein
MKNFFEKLKTIIYKLKANKGMTYVELIVVLSIFAIMSSVVLFNYGKFQAKVDINNLANDIALKIVQAQKDAMSGKWNSGAPTDWKPSYGVYFDRTSPTSFIYFADLSPANHWYDQGSGCGLGGECLDNINITKGNSISNLQVKDSLSASLISENNLSVNFTRPSSGATISSDGAILENVSYAQITVTSPQAVSARIKIYTSGRVEILQGVGQPSAAPNEAVE